MTNPNPKSRNAALALVSRVNRWLVALSVAATGAFALLAAHAFPGHNAQASSGTSGNAITTQTASNNAGATSDDSSSGSLQQPASTPSGSSSSSGAVVSGGS